MWTRTTCLLVLLLSGCTALQGRPPSPATDPARALDWTLGRWEGVRRGARDGVEDPMRMSVSPVLDGAAQLREIEIPHDGGVYRGVCLQIYDPAIERWRRTYVNDVRRRFASLEGEVQGESSVWRSVSPGRSRESRLVSERPAPDRWVRTMNVSEDGGATWRELWRDELRRISEAK